MSDQDSFFDDEPQPKGPGKSGGTSAKPSAKTPARSSGQPAPRSSSRPTPRSTTPPPVEPAGMQGETTWAIAALLAVVALLLGAICGFLLGTTLAGSGTTAAPATTAPAATTTQPSVLTTQQIQSGQLPPGHPSINPSASTAATGQ